MGVANEDNGLCIAADVMRVAVIMPADAADYTLDIFGNAKMNNTIDEDDITYVEDIISQTAHPAACSGVRCLTNRS
jgi:hypothetical protein